MEPDGKSLDLDSRPVSQPVEPTEPGGGGAVTPPLSEAETQINPKSPKHRGVKSDEYAGPSYTELRRRLEVAARQQAEEMRATLPPDYMLHEYRIEKVLGIGGFGVTYLAHDTHLDIKVAIKEYLPGELATRDDDTGAVYPRNSRHDGDYATGLSRFLLEARILAGFRHPNIVGVNRYFQANNTAYMVMAYEFGQSLNAWLAKRMANGMGRPGEAMLLQMFVPLLHGLEKVHQAGYLHRDIKPANIFVRDADGSLVLLDFGAARQASAVGSDEGITSIVTPGYAPFEQYHSHGRQGPWSDIYALGGVLYWFVAGRKPVEAAARIQSDPQESAVAVAGSQDRYSTRFLEAVDWALTPDDRARPQSVAEFLPALVGDQPASYLSRAPEMPPRVSQPVSAQEAKIFASPEAIAWPPPEPATPPAEQTTVQPATDAPTAPTLAPAVAGPPDALPPAAPGAVPRSGRRRKLAAGIVVAVLALAALYPLAQLVRGAPLSMAINPGPIQQNSVETGEWVASVRPLGTLLTQATGVRIEPLAIRDFSGESTAPGEVTKTAHDLYVASLDQIDEPIQRWRLRPLAAFRDFTVNLLVRADSGITSIAQLRGRSIAVYPAASSHGPIAVHLLTSSGLKPGEVTMKISRSPEAMVDALLFGQIDAVALPQYGADEALARYGAAKLRVMAKSEPYPGFILAAGPQVTPATAEKLSQALLAVQDMPNGQAALKALKIRQTTGTVQMRPVSATEIAEATGRLERARNLYPPNVTALEARETR